MALPDKKILTFNDLTWLINNEQFDSKEGFTSTKECVTKAEVIDLIYLQESPLLDGYADNQLVPRETLAKRPVAWVGYNTICEVVAPPSNDPPTAPTIVFVSKTSDSLKIDWSAAPGTDDHGIENYKAVLMKWDSASSTFIEIGSFIRPGSAVEQTFINLSPDTRYQVYVIAIDAEQLQSPKSNMYDTTTDGIPENLIGELNFTSTTTSSVSLRWGDPVAVDGIVSYYKINYRQVGNSWSTVSTNISASLRDYTVTGLVSTKDYEFRIRFYTDGSEWSNYSNSVIATTLDAVASNCNNEIYGNGNDYSQIFEYTMSGTGEIFKVELDPAGIPDRFRVFSGGNLLVDTGYIGLSSSGGYDMEKALLDNNVAKNTLRLDRWTGEGNTSDQFAVYTSLSASLIVGNKVTVIVDAPLADHSTGWWINVHCITISDQ